MQYIILCVTSYCLYQGAPLDGGDVRLAVEMLKIPTLAMPKAAVADTDGKVDPMAKLISERMVNEYVRQLTTLNQNICTLYSLVWGQCTDAMRQRVEALKDFSVVHAELDGLELLKLIKNQAFNFSSQKNRKHALHESTRRFFQLTQGKTTTTQAYFKMFVNAVDVIHHSGGIVAYSPGVEEDLAARENVVVVNLTPEALIAFKEIPGNYIRPTFR
eukprot:scaffold14562_cov45-Attheya_sp.AAC.2